MRPIESNAKPGTSTSLVPLFDFWSAQLRARRRERGPKFCAPAVNQLVCDALPTHNDSGTWIAHRAGIFTGGTVDALQLIARLQSRGRARGGSSPQAEFTKMYQLHKMHGQSRERSRQRRNAISGGRRSSVMSAFWPLAIKMDEAVTAVAAKEGKLDCEWASNQKYSTNHACTASSANLIVRGTRVSP